MKIPEHCLWVWKRITPTP